MLEGWTKVGIGKGKWAAADLRKAMTYWEIIWGLEIEIVCC